VCRIDDPQNRIAGSGLDEIARVVPALCDDAGECRPNDGAAGQRICRAGGALRLSERRGRFAQLTVGVFDLLARGDTALVQPGDAGGGRLRVLDARLGLLDRGVGGADGGRERRDLEPHEQISRANAIPFGFRKLRNPRRLGCGHDELAARGSRDEAARGDDLAHRAGAGGLDGDRDGSLRHGLFGGLPMARGDARKERHERDTQWKSDPVAGMSHLSGPPSARSRSASAA